MWVPQSTMARTTPQRPQAGSFSSHRAPEGDSNSKERQTKPQESFGLPAGALVASQGQGLKPGSPRHSVGEAAG
jgi:hypothetical protein